MSDPEAKLTAYQQRCRETCLWCRDEIPFTTVSFQRGAEHARFHNTFLEPYAMKCTAPTIEQFAEEMAQENKRFKRDDQHVWEYLAKATGHNTKPDHNDDFHNAVTVFGFAQTVVRKRDQWREKFEQRDRFLGVITACPNCDGSGRNANGDCCRIPGHAKECGCVLCQWKNAMYREENRANQLAEQIAAKDQEIARLKSERDSAIGAMNICAENQNDYFVEVRDLKAEIARLREALQNTSHAIKHPQAGMPGLSHRDLLTRILEWTDAALAAPAKPIAKDVHTEHCCVTHGCKYGDDDCSVTTRVKKQSKPCEYCEPTAKPTV